MSTLEELVIERGFARKLDGGKYSKWAIRLDADNLEALLWAIGKYGSEITVMKSTSGCFPEITYFGHYSEQRMRMALESIATVQETGRLGWQTHWSNQFSSDKPVFVPGYRERLSANKNTQWAQDLDERAFALLLWMVGEYGVRAIMHSGPIDEEYPPLQFGGEPKCAQSARAALTIIERIQFGLPMSVDEARRFVSDQAV